MSPRRHKWPRGPHLQVAAFRSRQYPPMTSEPRVEQASRDTRIPPHRRSDATRAEERRSRVTLEGPPGPLREHRAGVSATKVRRRTLVWAWKTVARDGGWLSCGDAQESRFSQVVAKLRNATTKHNSPGDSLMTDRNRCQDTSNSRQPVATSHAVSSSRSTNR